MKKRKSRLTPEEHILLYKIRSKNKYKKPPYGVITYGNDYYYDGSSYNTRIDNEIKIREEKKREQKNRIKESYKNK